MPWVQIQRFFRPKPKQREEMRKDKHELWMEIRKAHADWLLAQHHFENAVEKAEVDYAIFALEAAEKRYEMLLKSAKREKLSLIDSDYIEEVGS